MVRFALVIFLIFSGSLMASDLGTNTDFRFDQVVPNGCSPVGNSNNIRLKCGDTFYDYWYSNMSTAIYNIFGGATCGRWTGICKGGVTPGTWWVQNPQIDNEGVKSVVVCNSTSFLLWTSEDCKRIRENSTVSGLNSYLGSVTVKTVQIGPLNPGIASEANSDYDPNLSHSHGSNYEVNSSGYMYGNFNNDCPYENQQSASMCLKGIIKPGYDISNNCYILRDVYIPSNCAPSELCPCSGSNLPNCNKCVTAAATATTAAIKPDPSCNCDSNGNNCQCDKSNAISCDSYFMPNKSDPQYKQLNQKQKQCYACHSVERLLYKKCAAGVANKYKNISVLQADPVGKEILKSIYGPGTYICAFTQFTGKFQRIGCAKIPLGASPRVFPRIARYSNNNAARNLFTPAARVRQFRDIDFKKTGKPQFGVCGYGNAELGENYRGTFFKPKMHVVFGETDYEMQFDLQNYMYNSTLPSMDLLYGATDSSRISDAVNNNTTVNSPWNGDTPISIIFSTADKNCNLTQIANKNAKICTRLEYDPSDDRSYYAAYQANDICTSCSKCEKSNNLFKIGRVIRPPMKYNYKNGNPNSPISIAPINELSGDKLYNEIVIDPSIIPTVKPQYHANLSQMSGVVKPLYYDVKTSSVINQIGTDGVDPSCAMIFGHRFCVKRDQCSIFFDLKEKAWAEISQDNCNTNNCQVYQRLQSACEVSTYCPSNYAQLSDCLSVYPKNMIKATQNLSYYKQNIQWQDESCLSSGFEFVDHFAIPVSDDAKYGQYGDAGYDTVFAFSRNDGNFLRPLRNISIDDDNANSSILPVPTDVVYKNDLSAAASYLANLKDPLNNFIADLYFGVKDPALIQKNIVLRKRTMREMNLCVANTRNNYDNWDNLFDSSGSYDLYLPLRCQYFEYELNGGQGGGTNMANVASYCFFPVNEAWCIEYRYGSQFVTYKYNTAVGSDGGADKGIINNYQKQLPFISLQIGAGALTLKGNPNNLDSFYGCSTGCGWGQSCPFKGYGYYGAEDSFLYPFDQTTDQYYAKSEAGKSNISYCVGSGVLSGGNSFDNFSSMVGDIYNDGSFNAGAFVGYSVNTGDPNGGTVQTNCKIIDYLYLGSIPSGCTYNGTYPDSNTYVKKTNSIVYSSSTNIPSNCTLDNGSGGSDPTLGQSININCYYKPQTSSGSGSGGSSQNPPADVPVDLIKINCCKTERITSAQKGKDGSFKLRPARIKVDSYSRPILDDGLKTLYGTAKDPECTPMCPRINIKTTINNKNVICEYGGAGYTIQNVFSSFDIFDFQVPAGATAIPTKCTTEDGSIVYYPDRNYYYDAICNNGSVTDDNRFYGLCTSSPIVANDFDSYRKEFYKTRGSYWSMVGTYCPKELCPVSKFTDLNPDLVDKNILISNKLLDKYTYGMHCNSGGVWDTKPGSGIPAKRFSELALFCPAINADIFNFPSEWSGNVNWPQTEANSIAIGTKCKTGFIPHSFNSNFDRKCGPTGTWFGFNDLVDNVCLYSCQPDQDVNNFIKWDFPESFSNPISTPVCINGPVKKYVNGTLVYATAQYVWPTGKTANDFKRTCNIPGSADPLNFLYVNAGTKDQSVMPTWSPRPTGAQCVAPGFGGFCDQNLNVCYDSAAEGNLSFASCYNNAIYTINNIPVYPPEKKASGSDIVTVANSTVNVIVDDVYPSCKIDVQALGSQLSRFTITTNCSSLMLKSKVSYYDSKYNVTYYSDDNIISENLDTPLSALNTKYDNPDLANIILQNIKSDVAGDLDGCTFTSTSINYNVIKQQMISSNGKNYCSQICYLPDTQTMKFYDCTQEDIVPTNAACASVCSQSQEKWNYYESIRLTEDTVDGDRLLGSMTAANTQACIKKGLINVMPYLEKNNLITTKLSNYCRYIWYDGVIPSNLIIPVEVNNPIFNNQFDNSKLGCWLPKNCTLPNGQSLQHQSSVWVWVFDQLQGFNFRSNKVANCGQDGGIYDLIMTGAAFVKTYCYDGALFRVDTLPSLSYEFIPPTNCYASAPTLNDTIEISKDQLFNTYIQHLGTMSYRELNEKINIVDTRDGSLAQYNSLPQLFN